MALLPATVVNPTPQFAAEKANVLRRARSGQSPWKFGDSPGTFKTLLCLGIHDIPASVNQVLMLLRNAL
jgi:hypothetical protein